MTSPARKSSRRYTGREEGCTAVIVVVGKCGNKSASSADAYLLLSRRFCRTGLAGGWRWAAPSATSPDPSGTGGGCSPWWRRGEGSSWCRCCRRRRCCCCCSHACATWTRSFATFHFFISIIWQQHRRVSLSLTLLVHIIGTAALFLNESGLFLNTFFSPAHKSLVCQILSTLYSRLTYSV